MSTAKNAVRTVRFLGFLVKKGLLNDATAKALAEAKDQLVQSAGVVLSGGKEAVAELTSAVVRDLPKVKMAKVTIDPALADLFTKEEALENLVLPLKRDGRVVEVAITEESDFLFIIRRQLMKGLIFRFKTARVTELTSAINIYYEVNKVAPQVPSAVQVESPVEQPAQVSCKCSQMAKILLDDILLSAIRKDYQEIRFAFADNVLTVGGVRKDEQIESVIIPNNLHEAVISLLKEKVGLDSAEINTVVEKSIVAIDAIDGHAHKFNIVFSAMFGNQIAHVFPE